MGNWFTRNRMKFYFLWVLSDFITIGLITSVENDIKINAIIRYSKH